MIVSNRVEETAVTFLVLFTHTHTQAALRGPGVSEEW